MRTSDGVRVWFRLPERLVIFTFGLLFGKGMMSYVLANLMTFLTERWILNLKHAAIIVNLQEGLRNMLQIHVAIGIDAWLGYRRMLILSSILYSTGLGLLAFSVPQYFFSDERDCPLDEVQCFKKLKHTPFYEGLALLIVGGASQVIPLYSLSFDQTKVVRTPQDCEATRLKVACCLCKVKIGGWRQFQQRIIRWFCFGFMMLGTLTSVYSFLFAEDEWHNRFMRSAIAIVIGLAWFLCGFPFYGPRQLQPSPLITMVRTLTVAVRKRHLRYRDDSELHRGDGEENILLKDHLRWLNKATIKESPADDNLTRKEKRWKLCTVQEVEQTKLLLNIIPMSTTFIVYGMVKSLGNTFFIEQVDTMSGGISIIVFQMIQVLSKSSIKKGYQMVFENRIQRMEKRYSDGVMIGIGMLASILCCGVASWVESERLGVLRKQGLSNNPKAVASMSAWWLVLQFFFLGAMEGLAGDGIQDFFGHYAPDSRRYGPVFTSSLIGFGTLLNIGFLYLLNYYSKCTYSASWFGNSVNQSNLDSIYRAYAIAALFNCFLYAYVSTRYSYDNIIGRPEEQEEIPFLEVNEETEAGDQDNNQGQGQGQAQLRMIPVRG